MKKLMAIALSAGMVLSMTACGSKETTTTAAAETTAAAAETTAAAAETTAAAAGETAASAEKDPSGLAAAEFLTGEFTTLPADGETVNLIYAHAGAENSDAQTVALAWKEAIEYYSDGKITMTIYPNGQMGNDAEMFSSLVAGDIDMVTQSGSTHSSTVPETAMFDTPFLLAGYDLDKIEQVMIDSEFRDAYNAIHEAKGLKLLSLKVVDSMNLTSNSPVYTLEDLKGLKIRCAQAESRMAFWSALGANPTPMAFSELYMALQNGTVDAQDNVWANAVTSGAGEVQKYMIPTEHMMPSMDTFMNLDKFNSLPAEYQALMEEIAVAINHFDYQMSVTKQAGYYEQLQTEFGLEVCEVSDELRVQMKEAAAESINAVHTQVGNEEIYDVLMKCMNE